MTEMEFEGGAYVCVLLTVLGAVMASFLACQGERIATGRDWVHGRSVCENCGRELAARDLIPVFSYMINRGRCRYCGSAIPASCPAGEILGAAVLPLIYIIRGPQPEAAECMILFFILFGLSAADFRSFVIPDGYIIAGIANRCAFWAYGLLRGDRGETLRALKLNLMAALGIYFAMLIIVLAFEKITDREAMGGGDLKLFFMTALYMEPLEVLLNLILSCIIGLVTVAVRKEKKIPFGPAIAAATMVTVLFGEAAVSAYLGLFI